MPSSGRSCFSGDYTAGRFARGRSEAEPGPEAHLTQSLKWVKETMKTYLEAVEQANGTTRQREPLVSTLITCID
jgi:hypothetical protein